MWNKGGVAALPYLHTVEGHQCLLVQDVCLGSAGAFGAPASNSLLLLNPGFKPTCSSGQWQVLQSY